MMSFVSRVEKSIDSEVMEPRHRRMSVVGLEIVKEDQGESSFSNASQKL